MRNAEETALRGIEIATANLKEAQETFDLAMEKAVRRFEATEAALVRAKQYLEDVRGWDRRNNEIAAMVREGATGATISKTYGISRARAAQLFYRAQRENRPESEAD